MNDNLGRKVSLYDKSLANPLVVADTTSATANAYSSRAGGLIASAVFKKHKKQGHHGGGGGVVAKRRVKAA